MLTEDYNLISNEDIDKIKESIASITMYVNFIEDELDYIQHVLKDIKSETE